MQGFGSCLALCSWLRISFEVTDVSQDCSDLEAWPELSHGWQVGSSPYGFLHEVAEWSCGMETGFSQSKQCKRPRQKLCCLFWSGFGRHPPSLLSYSIDHTGQPYFKMGGDYTRARIPWGDYHEDPPESWWLQLDWKIRCILLYNYMIKEIKNTMYQVISRPYVIHSKGCS